MGNYNKLRGLMREKRMTQQELAKLLSINDATMSRKMNEKGTFTYEEICKMTKAMNMNESEFLACFFYE